MISQEQKELEQVEKFVTKSTEYYDDWYWDGEELTKLKEE